MNYINGTITIVNQQTDPEGSCEEFRQVADCSIQEKNGKVYVTYSETADTVEQGVESMLKIDGGRVTLRRRGGYRSVMVYETGRTDSFVYSMPFGEMQMKSETERVEVTREPNGYRVELRYALETMAMKMKNHMVITIEQKKQDK